MNNGMFRFLDVNSEINEHSSSINFVKLLNSCNQPKKIRLRVCILFSWIICIFCAHVTLQSWLDDLKKSLTLLQQLH
jgi:hypothetical protein